MNVLHKTTRTLLIFKQKESTFPVSSKQIFRLEKLILKDMMKIDRLSKHNPEKDGVLQLEWEI